MKRFAALAVIVALLATLMVMATPVSAAAPVAIVRFNGHPVFFDVEPIIQNGRTLVPFRAILEALGAKVSYNDATKTVTADRFGTKIELVLGSSTARINGRPVTIPDGVTAVSIKGRTMIPLRFISESMGMTVKWDAQQRIANIIDTKWPKRGGTLQLAMWSAPEEQFNPIMSESVYDSNISDLVFQTLVSVDAKMRPYGDLARYWDVSPDSKKLTFHLDRNARFHDGTPVTADDVKFLFTSIAHPNYKGVRNSGFDAIVGWNDFNAGKASDIAGIKVLDKYTIEFNMAYVEAPIFWYIATYFGVMPKHLYSQTPVEDWDTARDPMRKKPVGSGPFKYVTGTSGQFYMLEAHEAYNLGRPYVDRIVYKVLSQDTAMAQLEVGALDYADIKISDLPNVQKMSHLVVHENPQFSWMYLGFNTTAFPFDDKRVRQAAGWAIDADAIVSQLLEGHGGRMYHAIYPLNWAYTEEGVEKYPYNPQKAEQLLQQAGYKKGADGVYVKDGKRLKVEIIYPTGNVTRMQSAPLIESWLEAVGFEVDLTRMDVSSMYDKVMETDDFQAFLAGWSGGGLDPDPRDIYSKAQIGLFNMYNWWTPKSEDLMDRAVKTLDLAERTKLYHEWQRHFADELPLYPMYMANGLVAFHKRVKNVKASTIGDLWNIWEIYLEG